MQIQNKPDDYSRKSQKLAILSACFGSVPAVMIQDSAVIILFAGMLGAGSMLALVTTALFGVINCFFLLPAAYIAARVGYQRLLVRSSLTGSALLILLAFTPLLGTLAKYGLIIILIGFGTLMTLYVAAWFPMLDEFLPKEDRSRFFGMMRFSWQSCSVAFFFVCGLVMGKNPDLWVLQTIIIITAAALIGRAYYISKIEVSEADRKPLNFRYGLGLALSNKPLVGFSVYLAFLYLASQGTIPLTYVYLKNTLHTPDNIVVIVSSLALGGTIIGFLCAGRMISRIGVKKILLGVHLGFALINFLLFGFGGPGTAALVVMTVLLICYGFFVAASSVAVSSEMMALANPDNKALAMAFCGTMYAAGLGGARFLSSVIIGSGVLSPRWNIGAVEYTMFHTLYLGYGLMILFVCVLLVIVPAIFPKGNYHYVPA
ncbi:MAG: MFS transporter [Victivallaceae bacterium]|nr:MFS transporter [Victivallaceae bacterium]